jgi:hypothetical protein
MLYLLTPYKRPSLNTSITKSVRAHSGARGPVPRQPVPTVGVIFGVVFVSEDAPRCAETALTSFAVPKRKILTSQIRVARLVFPHSEPTQPIGQQIHSGRCRTVPLIRGPVASARVNISKIHARGTRSHIRSRKAAEIKELFMLTA